MMFSCVPGFHPPHASSHLPTSHSSDNASRHDHITGEEAQEASHPLPHKSLGYSLDENPTHVCEWVWGSAHCEHSSMFQGLSTQS